MKESRRKPLTDGEQAKQHGALFCLPLCCLLYFRRKVLVGVAYPPCSSFFRFLGRGGLLLRSASETQTKHRTENLLFHHLTSRIIRYIAAGLRKRKIFSRALIVRVNFQCFSPAAMARVLSPLL
jgi:hypothetical protein